MRYDGEVNHSEVLMRRWAHFPTVPIDRSNIGPRMTRVRRSFSAPDAVVNGSHDSAAIRKRRSADMDKVNTRTRTRLRD